MSFKQTWHLPLMLLALAALSACTSVPPQALPPATAETVETVLPEEVVESGTGEEVAVPVEESVAEPQPPSANPAVIALLDSASGDASAGRLPTATAAIERALRIEPRNPRLWHELAKLKLQKGDYQQAESFAARSNSWAGSDKALRASNWRLISEARSLRGDNTGARAALQRARALEQQ